jgi:release factor glutamine methyltransferase
MLVHQLKRERLPPGAAGLDLCTGSGVLAVAAARHGCREVTAVDVSGKAVLAARWNARLNGVRIRSVRGDLFEPVRGRSFDLIVSNPPYVPSPTGELPQRGLARAWEAGSDGRVFLDRICAEAGAHLRPGGVMLLVHSSVCGEQATLSALSESGLSARVALRHRGGLGPILQARADWLRDRQLLLEDDQEEMLVIRAEAPGADRAAGRMRLAAQSTIRAGQPANRLAS